ncbi:acyl-coenzyme A thioesterase PaaI-like protein [Lutibacter sp. Hel_I_33_5]|uniref:DUF4442 domain-containing protein n=1 Tax=Lutibacter sp. Hel_I_33_5 TaxID=1566289 RepID=UPI0011A2EAFF|nr:DUF4442 domain-containing protein [Lutibacter sp. Hel_I_33_5]TVZ55120.1 acyl-coenzyme A thioesterase PaaI-like protein [Lutibacter sp. Hel_I_33_5]
MYAKLQKIAEKFISKSSIYKYGFNLSPMYSRSTGRIVEVSKDLLSVKVKIKLSYKNSNYVGSIFGGSLFSATDPIFMIQLLNILDRNYVVWDKEATIKFKRPAFETCYVDFMFTEEEITQLKKEVADKKEIDLVKNIYITNKDKTIVFAEVSKTIYVADKLYYKDKKVKRNNKK